MHFLTVTKQTTFSSHVIMLIVKLKHNKNNLGAHVVAFVVQRYHLESAVTTSPVISPSHCFVWELLKIHKFYDMYLLLRSILIWPKYLKLVYWFSLTKGWYSPGDYFERGLKCSHAGNKYHKSLHLKIMSYF